MAIASTAAGLGPGVLGNSACNTGGSGRLPRTESTTIFKGTGFKMAIGLARTPSPSSPAMCHQ